MIKTVIFDFGNVLCNIDFRRCMARLQEVMGVDLLEPETLKWFLEFFKSYEKGQVDNEAFFLRLQETSSLNPSIHDLKSAWNYMIVGMNDERFPFLLELQKKYKVLLLSNSNVEHIKYGMDMIRNTNQIPDFESRYFHKIYYSHIIGMRKPDREIFDFITEDSKLVTNEILFIDDLPNNIEGAIAAGWNAVRHNPKTEIIEMLPQYLSQF